MISCPLCEHSQAAAGECEQCGKILSTLGTADAMVMVSRIDNLESTSVPTAGDVQVEVVPGLTSGREESNDPRTSISGGDTCRYCKNVQTIGAFCERCGMRMTRMPNESVVDVKRPDHDDESPKRCAQCGASLGPRGRCSSCG